MTDTTARLDAIEARANNPFRTSMYGIAQLDADRDYLMTLARKQAAALVALEAEVDAELQDAEPSNYEEDNFDAGYIHGLTFAQDLLRAAITDHLGEQ